MYKTKHPFVSVSCTIGYLKKKHSVWFCCCSYQWTVFRNFPVLFKIGQKLFLEENEVEIKRWILKKQTYMGSFVSLGWDFDHAQNLASSYKGFN